MSVRVLLIGPRGAGKSSVGRALARLLEVSFRDADLEVEREWGASIPDLMAAKRFRRAEAMTLERLLQHGDGVVATGGGAVEWAPFGVAAAAWRVIWLDAPPAVLADRVRRDATERPPLTDQPAADEMATVVAARAGLYERFSEFHVETSKHTPAEIALRIQKLLRPDHKRTGPNAD